MKENTKIIVAIGAESTGKSVLTKSLSNYYKMPRVPEFAREYIKDLNRKCVFTDLEIIAKKQLELLQRYKNERHEYIFVDTWLLIIQVWFEEVFNKVPNWLITEIKNTKIDLFLLCDTDLEWVDDPVRENGGEKRYMLQKRYIELLEKYKFNYALVNGKGEKRLINAVQTLNSLK